MEIDVRNRARRPEEASPTGRSIAVAGDDRYSRGAKRA